MQHKVFLLKGMITVPASADNSEEKKQEDLQQ